MLIRDNFAATTDQRPSVVLFWGTKSIDRKKVHPFIADYAGDIKLDENFNMATVDSQQYLFDLCNDLATKDFIIPGTVKCWIQDF